MKRQLTGTITLANQIVKLDRIKIPVWLLSITILITLVARSYNLFEPEAMAEVIVMASSNPGMRLFIAPIDTHSLGQLGEFTMVRMSFILAILFALMSSQLVIRHTRHNEDTGCAEMIGSTAVGRYATLAASLIVAIGVNLLMAALMALTLIINGLPTEGSLVASLSFAAFGSVFAAIAAVTTQLSPSARGANGMAAIALAYAFLVNSVGNVLGTVHPMGQGFESSWPVWLSPLGWAQQIYPYDQNNWHILLLFIPLFLILTTTALYLANHRDIGRGLLPEPRGPAQAPPSLLSPIGLAWRLQKGLLLAWIIPILIFGLVFGSVSDEFGEAIKDMDFAQAIMDVSMFLFTFIGLVGSIVTVYTRQALMRMRSEETEGRLESIMATAVTRREWALSHVLCAYLGSIALMLIFTLGLALGAGASFSETIDFIQSALAQSAAILAMGGFILALYALAPKLAGTLSLLTVIASIAMGPFFGSLFDLPQAIKDLSPFTHVPAVPQGVTTAITILLALAVVLTISGLATFRKRDLNL